MNTVPQSPAPFWSLRAEEACRLVNSTAAGLSATEAGLRLQQYGPNSLKTRARTGAALLFAAQFKSPLTVLLIVAAFLSMFMADFTNAAIILFIILLSGILGFWQEKGAAGAVSRLLQIVQVKCSVLRNGVETEIAAEQVVPGDVVVLNAGDIIPGDSLLLTSQELYMDEAAFTGETFPVEKNSGVVAAQAPLACRSNTLLMGSHVISGTATALVIQTGKQTEFGKIADKLKSRVPETEFEKGIRRFGYMLMEITLLLVLVIFGSNVLLHKPAMDAVLFSLALAVGLTPQLLPAIISINLSTGAKAMAQVQVIVKKLSSIENFGSMNILCSDKTGTITSGQVTLKEALDITGHHSVKTLQYAWLNASLQRGFTNAIDQAICNSYSGNKAAWTVQTELPYDFLRKRLTVQVRNGHENMAITKGAFNAVLSVCNRAETAAGELIPLEQQLATIRSEYEAICAAGYRVLGVAYKPADDAKDFTRADEVNMVFTGFITLFDPPKAGVQQTIKALDALGVRLKIITGDNEWVAGSLARQIGFNSPAILTGKKVNDMSEAALVQQALHTDIFAEVEPNQKERIILALKKSGNVVGFMGDGINDAPALHAADVGISVDTAVDVAKEAADIVLLQSGLEVLVTGIQAGRKTFTNSMKYIFMATSANFGNMFSMAGASLFLPFLPLLPRQILLTNLLTDFPEMAIATDSTDAVSVAKPRKWNIGFIQRFMVVFGLISSLFDYITFGVLLYVLRVNTAVFQTAWFTESVISASLIVLVVRTRLPFYKSLPGKYLSMATAGVVAFVLLLPYLPFAALLGFTCLPVGFYVWMCFIIAAYIFAAEYAKKWFFRKYAF